MTLPDTILPPLAKALAARGYQTLTDVQSAMLEPEAAGRDLLVSAQTGSGKTVAFGMAISPTLLEDAEKFGAAAAPLALVIAPTRELALQVQRELDWLYAEAGGKSASCVGGMDSRTERKALERGAHIVVGTPGRLRDHITRNALDLSAIRAVVLDEADEMLDLGFREDLEFILAACPEERRTLLFSATVPRPIVQLARTFQNDALRVATTNKSDQHADIDYKLLLVPAAERENAIINTLLYFDSASTIVFCSTREAVKHLSARLHNRGFSSVTLSGELTQAERTNALQSMRDGRARVCVATDVAARGIDLPNLDLVIHADMATNSDVLLHRSGRTGRAGRKGTCVLIAPVHRRAAAQRLLSGAKIDVTMMSAPTSAQIETRYRESILNDPQIGTEITEEETALVTELLSRHAPEAIAAAYLRMQMAARPSPEELTENPVPDKPGDKDPRDKSRFESGTWFKLSLGRKHKAEPRWLLPMICKAGGVTKEAVGSIRIAEKETLFEISASLAASFAANVAKNGTGERAVTISTADGEALPMPGGGGGKPAYDKPKGDKPYKAKTPFVPAPTDDFEKPPAKAKFKPKAAGAPNKDKGKPKWSKPVEGGAEVRKKPKKTNWQP